MDAVQPPSVPDENCVEKRVDLLGDAVGDTALKARGKKISYRRVGDARHEPLVLTIPS